MLSGVASFKLGSFFTRSSISVEGDLCADVIGFFGGMPRGREPRTESREASRSELSPSVRRPSILILDPSQLLECLMLEPNYNAQRLPFIVIIL